MWFRYYATSHNTADPPHRWRYVVWRWDVASGAQSFRRRDKGLSINYGLQKILLLFYYCYYCFVNSFRVIWPSHYEAAELYYYTLKCGHSPLSWFLGLIRWFYWHYYQYFNALYITKQAGSCVSLHVLVRQCPLVGKNKIHCSECDTISTTSNTTH